jgi:predicted ATPase/DNA-binding CsgD family transcriptional regulator
VVGASPAGAPPADVGVTADPAPAFGAVLRRHRLEAGLSQEALAERAHLSGRAISDLERGVNRTPRSATLDLLATALGLTGPARTDFQDEARRRAPAPGAPGQVGPLPLPLPLTPLHGRASDTADVTALLARPEVRLVTLTGPPGVGKSRLGLHVAAGLEGPAATAGPYPDGVWLVALAHLEDPALVAATLAHALGARGAGAGAAAERLAAHLRRRRTLLVLDNFEQVAPAAPLLAHLLAAAPGLQLLVTSRVALRLTGEHEYPLLPLPPPPLDPLPALPVLAANPAVALFVARAAAARAGFALTAANAPAVAELCVRLDGLPLALELAAARTKLLPPAALLARLGSPLDLLAGGPRDAPARQRTLRAALSWSHDLLAPAEQGLFARLAVFAGGCTLEAAAAVAEAPADGVPLGDAAAAGPRARAPSQRLLEGLASLVDHSLLLGAEGPSGEPRFRLLETLRAYALERLEASGAADDARRRHAAYYLALAEAAVPELGAPPEPAQRAWPSRLEAERDNLRQALSWALARPDAGTALRLCAGLWWYWYVHGHADEGRRWLEAALALAPAAGPSPPGTAATRAAALLGAGTLAYQQGDYRRAQAHYLKSLALHRRRGDRRGAAAVLYYLGVVARHRGHFARATTLLQVSLALRRQLGDRRGIGRVLGNLALVALHRGDLARATSLGEESLALLRRAGDRAGVADTLTTLGLTAASLGDVDGARRCYAESLALARALESRQTIASALQDLSHLELYSGDRQRAGALCAEGLEVARSLGSKRAIAQGLEGLAAVELAQGLASRAGLLCGAAEALRETIGAPLPPARRLTHERLHARLRAELGDAASAAAVATGRALTAEQAVAEALASPVAAANAPPAGRRPAEAPPEAGARRPPRPAGITGREAEILRLVAGGRTNRDIATTLVLSEATVKRHLANAFAKLNVSSRAAATAWALRAGLA